MKAKEFAEASSGGKPAPGSIPKPVLTEARKLTFKKQAKKQVANAPSTAPNGAADVLGPGVAVAPGSELHRIRSHNPTLWTKIQNWD